ncbi:MAG TPA: hypothetical protein DCS60_05920 [Opitutae bacterium]|nr:hypothetical protein [Opitutae bacterium]
MSRKLEFRLDTNAIRPIVQHVRVLLLKLGEELAAPNGVPGDDEIMSEFWSRDLLDSQRKDIAAIAELFDDDFMETGRTTVDVEDVDLVLKGCTVIRLKLRESILASIDDELLESGELKLSELTDEQESGYQTYVLFASLQELIISRMVP